MKLIFFFFSFLYYLLINIINTQQSTYTYKNFVSGAIYDLSPIPSGSSYTSNNTCVTYSDLIAYNYTDLLQNFQIYNKVYPENYCYSLLTYNITREDFFDIVNKNLSINKYL